jgi:hypothetical protein
MSTHPATTPWACAEIGSIYRIGATQVAARRIKTPIKIDVRTPQGSRRCAT